jgi:hypothetical protein
MAAKHSTGAKPAKRAESIVDPVIAGLKLPDGDERARLAWEAAAELDRFFGSLIREYDWKECASDLRPIPSPVLQAASRRGRDLARLILSAIGDDSTSTDSLDRTLGVGNRLIDEREAANG